MFGFCSFFGGLSLAFLACFFGIYFRFGFFQVFGNYLLLKVSCVFFFFSDDFWSFLRFPFLVCWFCFFGGGLLGMIFLFAAGRQIQVLRGFGHFMVDFGRVLYSFGVIVMFSLTMIGLVGLFFFFSRALTEIQHETLQNPWLSLSQTKPFLTSKVIDTIKIHQVPYQVKQNKPQSFRRQK